MANTIIRSSSQLWIDANLDFKSAKGINLAAGTAAGDAVEFTQMNTAIANAVAGVGNSIHVPVADLAAAKAVVLSGRADRMIMLIETLGLYRFDAEMITASNDNTIIRPTDVASDAAAGRWIKISTTLTDHDNLSNILGNGTYHLSLAERDKLTGIAANANNYVHTTNANLTGPITSVGNATTITNNAVTLPMMAQVATATFLGRSNAATGNVEAMTVAQAKTLLGITASTTRSYRVTPTGVINGSNAIFTIAANVISGTEEVFKNGILMNAGAGNDYTISYGATTTITFASAPSASGYTDVILVNYTV